MAARDVKGDITAKPFGIVDAEAIAADDEDISAGALPYAAEVQAGLILPSGCSSNLLTLG
ncbi:MAG: hypothetical protein WAN46_16700 [Gammaproteobacteria bacterium]